MWRREGSGGRWTTCIYLVNLFVSVGPHFIFSLEIMKGTDIQKIMAYGIYAIQNEASNGCVYKTLMRNAENFCVTNANSSVQY